MPDPPFDSKQAHRWFAVELNNLAWDLLEKPDRSATDAESMIDAAHASCYHWRQAGTVVNVHRAECLIGNVYAALGHGPAAVRHASRLLQLTEDHADQLEDWDLAFAYDCAARAFAASGETESALKLKNHACDAGERIAGAEDKQVFQKWHAGGNWHDVDEPDANGQE